MFGAGRRTRGVERDTHPSALTATDLAVIRATGVRKTYPGVEAVRGIDLTVHRTETFGFLGPNGAGKTTMIGMLCTLIRPSAGRIEIAGHDTQRSPHQVRRSLGLVFQESTLDEELTAAENLRFHADLYALPVATLNARIDTMLDLVGLSGRRHSLVRTFSGGMRRRLEIARGLLHRPSVLFLDEPTIGLDPQARAEIWKHLREMRERDNTTVFLTTHYLDEAELCDRIAIIDDGHIVAQGTPSELKSVVGTDRVALRTGDDEAASKLLRERFEVAPTRGRDGLHFQVENAARAIPALCAGLDVPVYEVAVTRPSLDDVFLHYTGRGIREVASDGGAIPAPTPAGDR